MASIFISIGAGGASKLVNLKDVTISNPTDTQVLVYDEASLKWINAAAPSSAGNVNKYGVDLAFNGSDLTKTVAVNATITNSRNAIWQLKDITNDYCVTWVKITSADATHVTIDSGTDPLPSGNYRLIGIE